VIQLNVFLSGFVVIPFQVTTDSTLVAFTCDIDEPHSGVAYAVAYLSSDPAASFGFTDDSRSDSIIVIADKYPAGLLLRKGTYYIWPGTNARPCMVQIFLDPAETSAES